MWCCLETTLTGESQFHISTPLGIESRYLMIRSKQVDHWTSGTVCECTKIAGYPRVYPQQPTMWLWSRKEDLQWAWNRNRRAVWDQVGLSHCRYDGLVTVRDKAHLRNEYITHPAMCPANWVPTPRAATARYGLDCNTPCHPIYPKWTCISSPMFADLGPDRYISLVEKVTCYNGDFSVEQIEYCKSFQVCLCNYT